MRGYFFCNMYLSSIQNGVQSAHVIHEMFLKYPAGGLFADQLWEWAEDHKTMIVLDGGFAENLRNIERLFNKQPNNYPCAAFEEEYAALEGSITSVGIILPQRVYQTADLIRQGETSLDKLHDTGMYRFLDDPLDTVWYYTKFDLDVIQLLLTHTLAR